jgi:hypothetical protein
MMGLIRGKAEAALDVLCHGGFPWASGAAPRASGFERRFRRHAKRRIMAQWPPLLRPFAALAMTLIWPVASLRDAARSVGNALPGSLGGRSRRGLALAAWGCALRRNVLPIEYLAFRMFERRGHSVDSWSLGDEGTRVFASLIAPEARALADDKHAFAAFCARAGVPAVPSLAVYAEGRPVEPFAGGQPPARDLVIKPRKGARTEGIEPWFWHGGAYHEAPEGYAPAGPALDPAGFERRLVAASKAYRQVLVQPVLRPHPALRALAGTGVATARVVSGAWPDGRVEIVDAMVQRPADGEFVSQGYRYALVDPETGRIRAEAEGQKNPVFASARLDPALAGLTLPDWAGCRSLVLRAHAAFPGPAPLLGWDVALSDAGPVVIETNAGLSFFQFQMASLRPALKGPLGPLIEAWL